MAKDPWRVFWGNALPQYGVTFAQYLVPLLTLPYLTRVLGAEIYGQVVLLTAFTSYFQLLIEFGFNLSAATSVSVHRDSRVDLANIRNAVLRGRLALALMASVIFSCVLLLSPFADGFAGLAIAYFVSAMLSAFIPIFMFRGLEVMPSLSAVLVGSRLLFAALVFLLVRGTEDVFWVPIANSLGSVVVIGYAMWHFKHKLRLPHRIADWPEVAVTARASFPYFIDAVSSTAFGALTVLFISISDLSLKEIALWGASYQLIAAAQSMYGPIMASLLPRMARSLDWALVRRLITLLGPAVLVACAALFAAADSVMRTVYGSEFANGDVLRALLPVLAISFPALLLGAPVLGAIGRQGDIARSTMIAGASFIAALIGLWALDAVELVTIAVLRAAAELLLLVIRLWHVRVYRRAA